MSVIVRDLSFSYGRHLVLDGVSFEARAGQMLALLGPNGVGKSTLFNCILGLLKPSGGELLVEDSPVNKLRPRELARRIAFVPQSHSPTFNYTVFDMVLMGTTARLAGASLPREHQMTVAEDALERVGISHLRDRGYLQISGGERQLTLIARALAQQANVIIMDEPTANLDYGNRLRVLQRVKSLVSDGFTVIQSTHNPDDAFLFADRVIALLGGKIAADGPPESAVTEELIEALYGIKVRITKSENGNTRCEPVL